MKATLNEIWTTPSTLWAVVTVWGDNQRWHRKFSLALPYDDIPEEALESLVAHYAPDPAELDQALPGL